MSDNESLKDIDNTTATMLNSYPDETLETILKWAEKRVQKRVKQLLEASTLVMLATREKVRRQEAADE